MTKDSVFFSFHAIKPSSSQHFYFASNNENSTSVLNYMVDAHSFDDIGSKPYSLLDVHNQEIFDLKQGIVSFDKLKKPHKKSHIFSGIVSFDEQLSKKDIFALYWQDIANVLFQTFIQYQDFDINQWEMQANLHYNTNNKHLQFRIYQNEKTPTQELFQKYWIQKSTINAIKNNILKYVETKLSTKKQIPTQFPHVLKGKSIYNYNKKIKENKDLILDFASLINSPSLEIAKPKAIKIADLYYDRTWFEKWLQDDLYFLNLNQSEQNQIRNIIKNNIIDSIYFNVQDLKFQKAYDYVVKKDPADPMVKKQKFKNFDHINKSVTFETISQYQPQTIKMVYKEPFARLIEQAMSQTQYDITELERAINNYIVQIRPNITNLYEFGQTKYKYITIPDLVKLSVPIKTFLTSQGPKQKSALSEITEAYYNFGWFKYWMAQNLSGLNLNQAQAIATIIKTTISNQLKIDLAKNKSKLNFSSKQLPLANIKTIFNNLKLNEKEVASKLTKYFNDEKISITNLNFTQPKDWNKIKMQKIK